MHSNILKKIILLGSVLIITGIGVAQTPPSNFAQAEDAVSARFDAGDYLGAQKAAEQALTLAKTPAEGSVALMRLGQVYGQRKLYPQAREQWGKMLALPGTSPTDQLAIHSLVAGSYSDQGNWSRSRTEWEQVLSSPAATTRSNFVAHLAIATAFLNEHNEPQARDTFALIAHDAQLDANTRALGYSQIAASFLREKQFDAAREALAGAQALPELSADRALTVQAGIAQSYKDQGDTARAEQEFDKIQPKAAVQFTALYAAKQFDRARAMMELFLSAGHVPPVLDAGGRMQLGYISQKQGKPAEAREVFQAVIDKQYTEALSPEAVAFLQAARQSARLAIARTYVQEGDKTQAQQVLQTLLASNNLDADVQTAAQSLLKSLD